MSQDDEIRKLKERIAFLERGRDVIDNAAEYQRRFEQYEAQISRLSEGLEDARRELKAFEKYAEDVAVVEHALDKMVNGSTP